MSELTDVERNWREFWMPIVAPDGDVDLEQVKRELFDYFTFMGEVAEAYCYVTGGKISKPNTKAFEVIAAHDDLVNKIVEESLKEERELVAAGGLA